ncbi:MAG: hypothetical protein F6K57_36345 [Moorea sp. SIO4A5]|nr:hypothetical protein [Moorena sp. SIO4A5]
MIVKMYSNPKSVIKHEKSEIIAGLALRAIRRSRRDRVRFGHYILRII